MMRETTTKTMHTILEGGKAEGGEEKPQDTQ
jgi:hypothetical protein